MTRKWSSAACAVLCFGAIALAAPPPAHADFVSSVTGAANLISPPASSVPGASLSNNYQIWDESSGKLSAPLTVDQAGQAGTFDGLTKYTSLSAVLPTGTSYQSTMIQLDPATTFPAQAPVATITFTNKIIGLALFGPSLDASDIYGNPTTVYPHGLANLFLETRGIDLTHSDAFTISSNGKTLTLNLTAGFGGFDQFRVLTAGGVSAGVPEPASLAVWTMIGAIFACGTRLFSRNRVPAEVMALRRRIV